MAGQPTREIDVFFSADWRRQGWPSSSECADDDDFNDFAARSYCVGCNESGWHLMNRHVCMPGVLQAGLLMNSRRYLCQRNLIHRFARLACAVVSVLALHSTASAQAPSVYQPTVIRSETTPQYAAPFTHQRTAFNGQLPSDVQTAFADVQTNVTSQFEMPPYGVGANAGVCAAGFRAPNAWGGYSIGDLFSGRLRASRALLPIADFQAVFFRSRQFDNPFVTTLDPSGYFRQVSAVTTPTGVDRYTIGSSVLLPGDDGAIRSGIVPFTDTGANLPGTSIPVQRASNLVLAQDIPLAYGGFFASSTVTVSDSGPFVAKTAGEIFRFVDANGSLQQTLVDSTGNVARTSDGYLTSGEDLDGDGMLDAGEDLNGDGILDPTEDINGDGLLEPSEDEVRMAPQQERNNGILDPSEDLNRNGLLDEEEDANGNNRLDAGEDLNNNGRLDHEEDINGNGILDPTEDLNANGVLDLGEDTNRNGVLDMGEDLNANGILDPAEDVNGNGILDPPETANGRGTLVYNFFREVYLPQPGDLVGRTKIAENNSPVPRDRFIGNFSYFDSVDLRPRRTNVQRFAPGFEKTLFGGAASVDVRIPFATTISSSIGTSNSMDTTGTLAGLTNTDDVELGNVSVAGKVLLGRNDYWAVSTGAQVTLPTAEDVRLNNLSGGNSTELMRIENESVHVMPFLAMLQTPNERLFLQYYAQYDYDATGNTIRANGRKIGKPKDVDFLYLDFSAGYWMYRNQPEVQVSRNGNRVSTAITKPQWITGFAPRFELHYNRALEDANSMTIPTTAGDIRLGNFTDDLESLNLTLGATVAFGVGRELNLAWGTPLMNRNDNDFDSEVRVYFNWILPN